MFGTLRLLLAFMVVLSHLPGSDYLVHFGFYAVCGFFVLSGFLMTAGLNEVYRFDAKLFWTNRVLRLLPPYYLVCLLTLLVVIRVPAEAGAYLSYWISDVPRYDIALNLLIIPQQYPELGFRLVPPFWSVAVELQMYVLLFFVASRNESSALATLWIGGIYHLACIYGGLGFGARYFVASSATLSFAAGTLIYFWTKRGVLNVTPSAAALAFFMWLANTIVARWLLPDEYAYGPGYYFATFLFVIVVAGLAKVQWTPLAQRLDRILGEIAYPVFLVQWLAGFLTALAISPGIWRGWPLTFASIPLILLMAVGISLLNGRLIEPLRMKLRRKATAGNSQEIKSDAPLRSA
jgi:peptidoglycan/LPS O-acetylase OafA/YrhL